MNDYFIPNLRHANPYETHQKIAELFQGQTHIWGYRGNGVLARSESKPAGDVFYETREIYFPKVGETVEFELVGNASVQGQKKLPDGTVKRRTLQYYQDDEAAHQFWLYKRAHGAGFAVVHLETNGRRPLITRKGASWDINSTSFSGAIEIIDAEKFAFVLRSGLGRARAFGHGLLTVQPVQSV